MKGEWPMRRCPFKNCGKSIKGDVFACLPHWKSMNLKNQALIWAIYNAYKAGTVSLELVKLVQENIMLYEEKKREEMTEG